MIIRTVKVILHRQSCGVGEAVKRERKDKSFYKANNITLWLLKWINKMGARMAVW